MAPSTSHGKSPSGYRLPEATRLGRVRLQVADLDRSLEYYSNVLGLQVIEQKDGRAVLGAHADPAPLVELNERLGAAPVPRRGRLGLYHFAILLPNRAALGSFARHLADISARAGASDHLVSEAFYLQDPDGLGIEVYADRPRSTWQVDGEQLQMATEPLDIDDLIQAATEPWAGMPSGTVIGHVHLHVADLRQGASFYHEALGFDAVMWSYPGALFLSAGGYHHHLGLNTWASGAPTAQADDARLLDWEVIVPNPTDADAAASNLRHHGYDLTREDGGWRMIDPWGTGLRVRWVLRRENSMIADARVQTTKGPRYLQALCGHFSHKVKTDYNAEQGRVYFEFGASTLHADAEALHLSVEASDAESLHRVKEIIGGHLERFAVKDALKVYWTDRPSSEDQPSGEAA